jgi:pimeloyl-ACP methyl ester carboxylesterase
MLAYDRAGSGEPLVLLHGTNCSRHVWDPVLPALTPHRDVIAIDLPAHGASGPTSLTPPGFAADVAQLFDALELRAPAVVGHSAGGWTALELAKLDRAGAVLALAPAGLWRKHSPVATDLGLRINWRLGQIFGNVVSRSLKSPAVRAMGLRSISARPGAVPYDVALATARDAIASKHFPEHFAATRTLHFSGGAMIPATVPIRIVWGDRDKVALKRHSRFTDQLPTHTTIDTWDRCGHMIMWDRPAETIAAALATGTEQP